MDYFKLLNFEREPFSNSPDPELFYHSKQHLEALQKLEIAVRLKRGLNVVIGDVGTGKTTLSRQLIQKLSNDDMIQYYVVLDPGFSTTGDFLRYLLHLFQPEKTFNTEDEATLKEEIKTHLFSHGVNNQLNIVIIIDEGQKLSLDCLEVLRELLNFETNDKKLLQIIIFAQKEFESSLALVENFKDRINFYYHLKPLNFKESKGLIKYRLEKCFAHGKSRPLFTSFAYFLIYRATMGFPRKMINLCHQIVLSLIIQNRSTAGLFLVRSCVIEVFPQKKRRLPAVLFLAFLFALSLFFYNRYIIQSDFSANILTPVSNKDRPGKNKIKMAEKEKPKQTMQKNVLKVTSEILIKDTLKTPEIYGSIRIPKKTTLGNMIYIVYGVYKDEYLDKIMMANPDIKSPEAIKAGMLIKFPVLSEPDIRSDDFFIVVSENTNIESAFQTAYNYSLQDVNVRILPVPDNDKKFLFPVVINRSFVSMDAADTYKKYLPGTIFTAVKKISIIKNNENRQKG
jgi:general secretion pathway protein A